MKRLALFSLLLVSIWSPNLLAACERADICEPPPARKYPSLARGIGLTIEHEWIEKNADAIHESFRPGCAAFGDCMSVWGNPVDFCRVLMTVHLRQECEKTWTRESDFRGWQQCRATADVYSMMQNLPGDRAWVEMQACAAEEGAVSGVKSPRVEIVPPDPPLVASTEIEIRAFDPDKGYPVYGLTTVGGVQFGQTFQPTRYSLRPIVDKDDLGRITLRMPQVVVSASPARESGAPAYERVVANFATRLPETVLEFDPPVSEWRVGRNDVRVTARDASTGEILAGRILTPGKVLGDTRQPFTIELMGGEQPCSAPIWLRPRESNRSDVTFPLPACE